jgi:hypothetical protein
MKRSLVAKLLALNSSIANCPEVTPLKALNAEQYMGIYYE